MECLIKRSLELGDVTRLISIPELIMHPQEAESVKFIREYLIKYGQAPLLEVFEREFPNIILPNCPPEPLDAIYDREVEILQNEFIQFNIQKRDSETPGSYANREYIQELYRQSFVPKNGYIEFDKFDRTMYFQDRRSFDFNLPWFDEVVGKIHGGEIAVFVARPKSFKTTLLLMLAIQMSKKGQNILLSSGEMGAIELMKRLDAMTGNFNTRKFRQENLSEEEKSQILNVMDNRNPNHGKIMVYDSLYSADEVSAAILNTPFTIDVAIIDAINAFSYGGVDSSSVSISLGRVAYDLKRVCVSHDIAMLCSTHAKRPAQKSKEITPVETDDVANSDMIVRAVDYAFGLTNAGVGSDPFSSRALINLFENRHGESGFSSYMQINWDKMSVRFFEAHDISFAEVPQAADEETKQFSEKEKLQKEKEEELLKEQARLESQADLILQIDGQVPEFKAEV